MTEEYEDLADYLELPEPVDEPVHELEPVNIYEWSPKLVFDLALAIDSEEEILQTHGITPKQWELLKSNRAFLKQLSLTQKELREDGVTFRAKAKMQAESYLLDIHNIVTDPMSKPETKLRAIEKVVVWAGHETKEAGAGGSNSQFNISIILN